jgi:hypothetical protein
MGFLSGALNLVTILMVLFVFYVTYLAYSSDDDAKWVGPMEDRRSSTRDGSPLDFFKKIFSSRASFEDSMKPKKFKISGFYDYTKAPLSLKHPDFDYTSVFEDSGHKNTLIDMPTEERLGD